MVRARRIAIVVYYLPYFDFSIVQIVLFSPAVVDRIAKWKEAKPQQSRIHTYIYAGMALRQLKIEFRIRCEAMAAIDHIVADLIHAYRHIISERIVS